MARIFTIPALCRNRALSELVSLFPHGSEALASALVDGFTGGHLGGQAFNESAGRVF
jgi:hypothetical protein